MWPVTLVASLVIFQSTCGANNVRYKRQEDSCITMSGEPGICIAIRDCKVMFDFIVANKHDLQVRHEVRKSHCGFIDKHPKVCCKVNGPELPLTEIDLPLPTLPIRPPLEDRLSTEVPLSTSESTSTTPKFPFSSSEIPTTLDDSWSSSANTTQTSQPLTTLPTFLSSSETPLVVNLDFSSTSSESPPTTSDISLSTSEIPFSSSEIPILSTENPLSSSVSLLSTSNSILSTSETSTLNLELPLSTEPPNIGDLFMFNPSQCGKSVVPFDRNITGAAPLNAWPWLALLEYQQDDNTTDWLCAGSLITDRHILTVAHCVTQSNLIPIQVRLGELETSSSTDGANPIDIQIEEIIVHPEFNSRKKINNIAIIVLKDPVTFNDSIRPICLPFSSELRHKNFTDASAYIAGWGAPDFLSSPSTKLLETRIEVVGSEQCEAAHVNSSSDLTFDENILICAGGDKTDVCSGDAGVPLMFQEGEQMYEIGIVSHGLALCGEKGFYSVYTRVVHYLDWIVQNVMFNYASFDK